MDMRPEVERTRSRVSDLRAQSDRVQQRARELASYSASLATRLADTEQALARTLRYLARLRPEREEELTAASQAAEEFAARVGSWRHDGLS